MSSPDLLEAAGRRAALRPVPTPPAPDALANVVAQRRTKKRQLVGGAMAAAVAVVSIPLGVMALSADSEPDVVTEAAASSGEAEGGEAEGGEMQSGEAVLAADADSETTTTSNTSTTTAPDTASGSDDTASGSDDTATGLVDPLFDFDGENFDLDFNFSDESFAIEVNGGDGAAAMAAAAEAAANETRIIDGQTVWLLDQGDTVTASALVEDELFISVTAPAEDIDEALDLLADHSDGSLELFDEGFPFDGPLFDEGDLPEFDDEFNASVEEFSECMESGFVESDNGFSFTFPDCDFPEIDGVLLPDLGEFNLDFDFDFD